MTKRLNKLLSKSSFSKKQLLLFITVFAALGGVLIYRSLANTAIANIWVDVNGGSCTRSATSVAYNDAAACGGLSSAVAIANPGDVIGWKGGTYGMQVIANKPALRDLSPGCDPLGKFGAISTANCVKITPATGEIVIVNGSIEARASSLWIKGSVTNNITAPQNFDSRSFNIILKGYISNEADSNTSVPDHNTFEGIDALQIGAYNSKYIVFSEVDAGPATKGSACSVVESLGGALAGNNVATGGGLTPEPTNIWFEKVLFHDHTRDQNGAASDCHTGGFFAKGGNNVTFKGNVWKNNSVYNVQMQRVGSGPQPSSYTFENNWFDCPIDWPYASNSCIGQPDIQFNASDNFSDELIRYNSFVNGIGCQVAGCTFTNSRFIGNAGSIPSQSVCGVAGTTWAYNAWVGNNGAGTTCAASDASLSGSAILSLLFTSTIKGAPDLHLANNTNAANNLVTPTTSDYITPTDIDNQTRTSPRDAGADEYSTGTPTPKQGDLNNDGFVTILDLSILLSNYGKTATPSQGDINGDGNCTILDLSILLSKYGT